MFVQHQTTTNIVNKLFPYIQDLLCKEFLVKFIDKLSALNFHLLHHSTHASQVTMLYRLFNLHVFWMLYTLCHNKKCCMLYSNNWIILPHYVQRSKGMVNEV
jgi:hypothetical protein